MIRKTFIGALSALSLISILASCGASNKIELKNASISEDTKFGAAIVDVTISSFNESGFALGDSCDVVFDNGYSLTDVPYFDGYYVKNGSPVIVAYPGDNNIRVTLNNVGIWETANLSDECVVTITLKEEKKYLATQEALGQSYSFERSEYDSDEEFGNFRALEGGTLKKNLFYRGASPVDNSRKRAKTVDALLEKNGIKSIMDLADSENDMQSYLSDPDFSSDYAKSLYENGKVSLLSMGSSYSSSSYKQSVVKGFKHILNTDGPYYIHCMEGKDRTGFVCTLLEALAGASYYEMRDDYMKTYENYYRITLEKTPDKYNAVSSLYFDSFLEELHKRSDVEVLKKANYIEDAKRYLSEGGMTENEISSFVSLIGN